MWESRVAAEAVYNGELRGRVEKLYGVAPSITWFDVPVAVDNVAGGTITKAAWLSVLSERDSPSPCAHAGRPETKWPGRAFAAARP